MAKKRIKKQKFTLIILNCIKCSIKSFCTHTIYIFIIYIILYFIYILFMFFLYTLPAHYRCLYSCLRALRSDKQLTPFWLAFTNPCGEEEKLSEPYGCDDSRWFSEWKGPLARWDFIWKQKSLAGFVRATCCA